MKVIVLIVGLLTAATVGLIFFFVSGPGQGVSSTQPSLADWKADLVSDYSKGVIDWALLGKLDYKTGVVPDELQKFNGKTIRIAGFMVPIEDYQNTVTEFLLVPSPLACVHVPPPPPNYTVYVKMDEGTHIRTSNGPIWVEGELAIAEEKAANRIKASYVIHGKSVTKYTGK